MQEVLWGDALSVLTKLPEESVDLIYLDPPFFTGRNFKSLWNEDLQFEDKWEDIYQYLEWLKEIMVACRMLLKPTGSLWLHCNRHADAYIEVKILDVLFKRENLRNKVVWKDSTHSFNSYAMNNITETIFYYAKSKEHKSYIQRVPCDLALSANYTKFKHKDKRGLYMTISACCSTEGWVCHKGDITMDDGETFSSGASLGWKWSEKHVKKLYNEGMMHITRSGSLRRKVYADTYRGRVITNLWDDLGNYTTTPENVSDRTKEQITKKTMQYPTGKPVLLLKRIIEYASKEGDLVVDPFCGGGTTAVACKLLRRNFICSDKNEHAIDLTLKKLKMQEGDLFDSIEEYERDFTYGTEQDKNETIDTQQQFNF